MIDTISNDLRITDVKSYPRIIPAKVVNKVWLNLCEDMYPVTMCSVTTHHPPPEMMSPQPLRKCLFQISVIMFLSHYGYRRNQTHRKLLLHNNVDMTTDGTGDIIERKVETEQK